MSQYIQVGALNYDSVVENAVIDNLVEEYGTEAYVEIAEGDTALPLQLNTARDGIFKNFAHLLGTLLSEGVEWAMIGVYDEDSADAVAMENLPQFQKMSSYYAYSGVYEYSN